MKKLLLILLLLPMIGFSQFGKYTSNGQFGIYWNTHVTEWGNEMPVNARAYLLTDTSTTSAFNEAVYDKTVNYNLFRGSLGFFYNFKSKLVFNKRINLGADYFYYYPTQVVYNAWTEAEDGSDAEPHYISQIDENGVEQELSAGGNAKRYLRITTGLGIPFWYFKRTSTDFNINNITYLGATSNNTFDVNLTYNFGVGQVIVGYETSAKLSADFKNFYLTDDQWEGLADSDNHIQFPNLYISLRLGVSLPVGKGTWADVSRSKSREWKDNTTYASKPTEGCIRGNCENGKGIYVDRSGRYKGRFKDGRHHGQGVMNFSDGSSYDGKWRAGNRHGKGTYISKYKEELAGDWIDDEFADPKLKPELKIRNIVFKDSDGDDEIYAEESGKINFEVENVGKGTAYNIIFTIKDLNNIKGLEFEKRIRTEKLKSKAKQKITIPFTSDLDLRTGLVNIMISSEELNGFPADEFSINFKSLAYINPDLKIIDYNFSSMEEGQNKLLVNDRASLTFIVQNRGQGRAQDIVVDIDFTSDDNIFAVDDKLVSIKSLSANESKTITFEFFTNTKFDKKNIGISVDVKEKFNKYGESKVLSQEIGKEMRSNLIVNYDGGDIREKVVIDNLSLSSLVDKNIPTNGKVNNRFALIIGNEDYQSKQTTLSSEQNVDYAVNDATIFKKYSLKTLGVKEENMFFLLNATAGQMSQEVDLISKILSRLGNKAELIVYYAGHGYPDELTKVPYLIPVDISATNLSSAIKLSEIYTKLSSTGARKVTVFLDACFTGGGRNSGLIASRGVKVKPKEGSLEGNLLVFSASSGDQSSLPYHKESHGMFTYHLLKKLQESKGDVSMGDLSDYLVDNVSLQSLKENKKEQDPKVNTSQGIMNEWRTWKF